MSEPSPPFQVLRGVRIALSDNWSLDFKVESGMVQIGMYWNNNVHPTHAKVMNLSEFSEMCKQVLDA